MAKEEWHHRDAPKAVNLGIWSMAAVAAFAFALMAGTALTQTLRSPISASQETTTCPSDSSAFAINNYPGLAEVNKGESAYKHGVFEDAMGGNYRCSWICVKGTDKSKAINDSVNQKVTQDYLSGATMNGKEVNVVADGAAFRKLLDNPADKEKMPRTIILNATKASCQGAPAGQKGGSVDYDEIKTKQNETVKPIAPNTTSSSEQSAAQKAERAAPTSPRLEAPVGGISKKGGGTKISNTGSSNQKDVVPPPALPTYSEYTIEMSGIERYSNSQTLGGQVYVIASLGLDDRSEAGFTPTCTSKVTDRDGGYSLSLKVSGEWYEQHKNATIHFYAYKPNATSGKMDERNASTTYQLNDKRTKVDQDKIKIGFKPESLKSEDPNSEPPIYTKPGATVAAYWDSFKAATGLDADSIVGCGVPEQKVVEEKQQTEEQPTVTSKNVTFKIKGNAYFGDDRTAPKEHTDICVGIGTETKCQKHVRLESYQTQFEISFNATVKDYGASNGQHYIWLFAENSGGRWIRYQNYFGWRYFDNLINYDQEPEIEIYIGDEGTFGFAMTRKNINNSLLWFRQRSGLAKNINCFNLPIN